MNKLIKISTILVVTIGAIASFAPSFAFATSQASFSSSGMFEVGNHANAGTYAWTTQLNNMKPGDQVAFNFNFLNTSSVTAIDAKSSFSATSNSNCIQVTGTIWAQNAPSVSQSVSICAASGYTISLSQSSASFGGVGDVLPGSSNIEYYATGLYSITGQATVQNPTANLWAEYPNGTTVTQVPLGTAPYLHWTSTNASECHALAGAGFSTGNATQGQDQVSALAGTTTFSIQCTNSSGGSVQANATVSVTNPPAAYPTANISASPTTVNTGGSSTLTWSSTNATECHATSGGFSTGGATSGSVSTGSLYNSTTYSISCGNTSGSATDSVTVSVNAPVQYPTVNISANPTYISSGGTSIISWTSTNASECHATQGAGFSTGGAVVGSDITSALYSDTNYSVTCSNSSGSSSDSVVVRVNNTPPINNPTANISANPTSVNSGNTTTIQWSSTNASECHATGGPGFSTSGATSGSSASSALTSTSVFSVTCTNSSGGTASNSVTVYVNNTPPSGSAPSAQTNSATGISQSSAVLNGSVNPNGASTSYWFEYGTSQSLGNTSMSQSAGSGNSSGNVSATISGLNSNTTYYFRVDAQNSYGTTNGSILSFTTSNGGGGGGSAPTVQTGGVSNLSTNSVTVSGTVDPNSLATTYWFEYGTSQSLGSATAFQSAGSGSDSNIYTAGLSSLMNNTTYYYRIAAQNSVGTSYGSILNFTTGSGGDGGGCTAPFVSTSGVNSNYQNSAQLSGSVNPNNCDTTYWFEYGINYWMGNMTAYQSLGSSNSQMNVNANISGLSYNTTYYYRAVAQNSGGTSYGNILSFQTSNQGGCTYGNCNNYGSIPSVQTNSSSMSGNNSITFYGQVTPNNSDTYAWFAYGTDPNNLYSTTNQQYIGSGSYQQYYNQIAYNLNSGTTYYYQAVARNSNGTAYGQILNTSTGGGNYGTGAPTVTTNSATYIYSSSALLNGQVDPNGAVTSGWFEYGLTTSLGSITTNQAVGSGNSYSNISFALSGLNPNTTYYYRAAAQNNSGTAYGSILSFTTGSGGVIVTPKPPTTIVVTNNVGTGSGVSCVILVPSLNVSELQAGNTFTYTVTYRNGCTYNLSNVYMKVILPPGTQFVSTNYPFFNRDANGISYNLGALPADFQSAVSIQGLVDSSVSAGNTLIFSSVINFNDVKGRFQSISAYLTAVVGSGQTLGATVIDAFGALLGNWLFDLLLLIVLIFLIYWIFFRRVDNKERDEDALEAKPFVANK